MSRELTDPQHRAIESLIEQGKILDAIQLYRSYTDCYLSEAKDYIEARMQDYDLDPSQLQTGTIKYTHDKVDPEEPENAWALIAGYLYMGKRIKAIRIAREQFGVGLKEAREMVARHEALLREKHPNRFAPGSACALSGCTVKVSIFLIGVLAAAASLAGIIGR